MYVCMCHYPLSRQISYLSIYLPQADLALDSMRAEISSLKAGANGQLDQAQASLITRVRELEKEVEVQVGR